MLSSLLRGILLHGCLVILCKIQLQLTVTIVPTKPATDRPRIDNDDCICTIDHGA